MEAKYSNELEVDERLESPDRDLSQGYVSDENLSDVGTSEESSLPSAASSNRVFTNKSLNLAKIKCFGFDMDYTLCEYISPAFDELAFDLAKQHLVSVLGYSPDVLDIQYNPRFPVRGLWYDKQLGNLLKVDQFGKILQCTHGYRNLNSSEIRALYPHKIQRKDDERVFVMNTLFNLAETHLIASLVHFMNSNPALTKFKYGWRDSSNNNKETSYKELFLDLRKAIDHIHLEDSMELKSRAIADLPRYVKKDGRLPLMLQKIKDGGRKTFLLTNSDWWYTRHIMHYLLGDENDQNKDGWLRWFDLTVVDGWKPRFFTSSRTLSRVDTVTSTVVPLETELKGQPVVYSGGDHNTITSMIGVEEPEILYCGDHLYADVVKCRKECEWRTLLVVPELEHEVKVSHEQEEILEQLHKLESLLSKNKDQLGGMKDRLTDCVNKLDKSFSHTGSLFRAGSRLTYFGSQLQVWADIYTGSVTNLMSYSVDQHFLAAPVLLPHETRNTFIDQDE